MEKFKPTAVSGFPEWLPEVKILENKLLHIIRKNYERFGFVPIETPAVERSEMLTAKGGNEKEIYSLNRLAAEEDEEAAVGLSLHFDLTVPLARYVAQHHGELIFPFRVYQAQKVWRGGRPQAGRFKEFYQYDIDVIGDGQLSQIHDAEIPSIIYHIFKEMQIGRFIIRINNRKILQGLLQYCGLVDQEAIAVMKIIDKLEKIGTKRVFEEIKDKTSAPDEKINEIINFISTNESSEEILARLAKAEFNDHFSQGVQELTSVFNLVKSFGVPDDCLAIDLKMARGLDYYTGTIYETILRDHPGLGSICSGGRYDDLASYFTDKKLPGVGISIGVTRLVSRLVEAGIFQPGPATVAPVLITKLDHSWLAEYLGLANQLRQADINVEVFLEDLPLKAQMKYANRKKFIFAIIAGEQEFSTGRFNLRNLHTGDQNTCTWEEIASIIKKVQAN
jgi:histidyl-tRNA synthetase